MTTELSAIAFKAQTHPKHRFQNLYGMLNASALYRGWANLNKQAAAGIDGVTTKEYEQNLPQHISTLHQKAQSEPLSSRRC